MTVSDGGESLLRMLVERGWKLLSDGDGLEGLLGWVEARGIHSSCDKPGLTGLVLCEHWRRNLLGMWVESSWKSQVVDIE